MEENHALSPATSTAPVSFAASCDRIVTGIEPERVLCNYSQSVVSDLPDASSASNETQAKELSRPSVSVVIPTYNRRVILEKALLALAKQTLAADDFEVIVIDDGSTDGTAEMIEKLTVPYHLVYRRQKRGGPASARNHGLRLARADLIVFIDSDIVVCEEFLAAHKAAHAEPGVIGHGPVIHTDNLDDPTSATMKITDISRAFFATGNASIRKQHVFEAGLFDEDFVEYGWEDLELGIRLRRLGLKAVQVPEAKGYHYKKRLTVDDVPNWCQRELERGHTAVIFYRKVPTFRVRMMTNITPVAFGLDRLLTVGNWPGRQTTQKLLRWLENRGHHLALRFVVRIITHHAYMNGIREALRNETAESPT